MKHNWKKRALGVRRKKSSGWYNGCFYKVASDKIKQREVKDNGDRPWKCPSRSLKAWSAERPQIFVKEAGGESPDIPLGSGMRDGHCWPICTWQPEAQVELGMCPPWRKPSPKHTAIYFYIECLSCPCSRTVRAKINRIFRENYNTEFGCSSHCGQEDEKHHRNLTNATRSFFFLPNAKAQGKNKFVTTTHQNEQMNE